MTDQPFYAVTIEIRILMSMVTHVAIRHLEDRLRTMNIGISGLQVGVLRTLSHNNFTLSELSKKFMLDPSTLVPVVDALERKGYVMRGKDVNDRRRIPLSVTEEGLAILNNIPFSPENDMLHHSLESMGEEKTHVFLNLLRELVRSLPNGDEMLQEVSTRIHAYSCEQPPISKSVTDS